jgi:hypothetical protein
VDLPHLALRFGSSIDFEVDSGWLLEHPLTHYLLEEEAILWERTGVRFALKVR